MSTTLALGYLVNHQTVIGQYSEIDNSIKKAFFIQFLQEDKVQNRKEGLYLIPIMLPITRNAIDINPSHIVGIEMEIPESLSKDYFNTLNPTQG